MNLYSETRLIAFIQNNKVEELVSLLDDDRLEPLTAGDSVIDFILGRDRHDILHLLLKKFPSLLLSKTKKKNQTLLHLAVTQPSILVTTMLLTPSSISLSDDNFQQFVDAQNSWGETALHLVASTGNEDLLALLLKSGANPDIVDQWGRTAGAVAREQGYEHLVTKFGLNVGSRTDMHDGRSLSGNEYEQNAEHAKEKQQGVAKEFMSALSSLKLRQRSLHTEHETILSVDHELKVKVKTIFGEVEDRITFADSTGTNNDLQLDAPKEAIRASCLPPQATLSPSRGINVKPTMALSKLMEHPVDPQRIKLLLQNNDTPGVDVNGKDMFGITALQKAASWDAIEVLDILLSHPTIDISAVVKVGQYKGFTALHFAIHSNSVRAILRLLKDKRMIGFIKSSERNSIVDLARKQVLNDEILSQLQLALEDPTI